MKIVMMDGVDHLYDRGRGWIMEGILRWKMLAEILCFGGAL